MIAKSQTVTLGVVTVFENRQAFPSLPDPPHPISAVLVFGDYLT